MPKERKIHFSSVANKSEKTPIKKEVENTPVELCIYKSSDLVETVSEFLHLDTVGKKVIFVSAPTDGPLDADPGSKVEPSDPTIVGAKSLPVHDSANLKRFRVPRSAGAVYGRSRRRNR